MKYNTKDVYLGNLVFNAGDDGYYFTGIEAFVKVGENSYKKINSKKELVLSSFSQNTKKYMTVSNLIPITNLMNQDKIPAQISYAKIKLYLLKHQLSTLFNDTKTTVVDNSKKPKTK